MKVSLVMWSFAAVAVGSSIEEEFEKLKQELRDLKEDMINLKAFEHNVVLKSKQEIIEKEEINHKIVELEEENLVLKAKVEKIETEDISTLRNPPFYHMCAYQDGVVSSSSTNVITYDKILYLSSYRCDEADVNLGTGVFTAGFPGTYTVTWALIADNDVNNHIYLSKNGERIDESHQESASSGSTWNFNLGVRTLLLHLDTGDTLDLTHSGDDLLYVTFCVSLSTFDVI